MFLVNGEWLDHGDPRVDAMWFNAVTGTLVPPDMRGEQPSESWWICNEILAAS